MTDPVENYIPKKDWPILHYAMKIAIPYNVISWIVGVLLKADFFPEWGEVGNLLVFVFTPIASLIVTFDPVFGYEYFGLLIYLVFGLFLSWVLIAPFVGAVLAILNK